MARRVARRKGKQIPTLIADTKTAAGHYAKGYRDSKRRRLGLPATRGTVKVQRIGDKWGVFDYGK